MKKKLFGGIAISAFATIVGLTLKMDENGSKVSDLALNNVEAVADCELSQTDGTVIISCRGAGSCSVTGPYNFTCNSKKVSN